MSWGLYFLKIVFCIDLVSFCFVFFYTEIGKKNRIFFAARGPQAQKIFGMLR
jgi:hypothetical protein